MHLSDSDCGDLIFNCLTTNGPLNQADIRALTGLTAGEFRRGIDFIRDTLADQQGEVYTYDPHQRVYVLATQEAEALRYVRRRTRAIKTQVHRVNTGTIYPAMAKWGSPTWGLVQMQGDQMEQSLQFAEDTLTASLP